MKAIDNSNSSVIVAWVAIVVVVAVVVDVVDFFHAVFNAFVISGFQKYECFCYFCLKKYDYTSCLNTRYSRLKHSE